MTIAACYVSPEGVVLGADSTATYFARGGAHYYNHAQKLFEIGNQSTLGVVTWGIGGLAFNSYRRLFAIFAEQSMGRPVASVSEVGSQWADFFWSEYDVADFVVRCRALHAKSPYDPTTQAATPNSRTQEEEDQYQILVENTGVGFCIAGYVTNDRMPSASVIWFDPLGTKPTPTTMPGGFNFWGAPSMIMRLLLGYAPELRGAILASGKWGGSEAELDAILAEQMLGHPVIPIRDAIDFINAGILSTIKALKFSNLSQICGGPIELAVITADRPFRWVRHKQWDSAIAEGERNDTQVRHGNRRYDDGGP